MEIFSLNKNFLSKQISDMLTQKILHKYLHYEEKNLPTQIFY